MTNTRTATSTRTYAMDRFGSLNRMLEQVLPDSARHAASMWVPALEVAERADAYLIAVDLPGVREDQMELSFENNVLTLRGTRAPSFPVTQEGTLRLHLTERQSGSFERSVRLPEFVEGDRIEANFVDGVLQVTVPKSAAAQPRKIPVSGARSSVSGETGDRAER